MGGGKCEGGGEEEGGGNLHGGWNWSSCRRWLLKEMVVDRSLMMNEGNSLSAVEMTILGEMLVPPKL